MSLWLGCCALLALIGLFVPDGLPVAVVVLLPVVLLSVALCSLIDRDGAMNLVSVLLLGVTVRWVIGTAVHVLVNQNVNYVGLFAPDELTYEHDSWLLAEYFHGHIPDPFPDSPPLGIVWFMSGVYYVFGQLRFIPKL